MKLILSFVLVLLFLSSCSKQQTKPLHLLELNNSGVNGLDTTTPYQEYAILPHIRGYDVTMFSRFEAGEAKSIIRITYDNQEVMYITPTYSKHYTKSKIKSISIVSNFVTNPFGLQIDQIYDESLGLYCKKKKPKQLECAKEGYDHIALIFSQRPTQEYHLSELVWSKDALR